LAGAAFILPVLW